MAYFSEFSRIDEYRQRALSGDPEAMNGGIRRQSTRYALGRALDWITLAPGQVLVDIGSGDGTLFRLAFERCADLRSAIGVTPAKEERDAASRLLSGIPQVIISGSVHDTGLAPACADVVVCNGVLLLCPPIEQALQEIARIAKPGAQVFIGEVPDGPKAQPRSNPLRAVASNLKHRGLFAALATARYLARAAVSGEWHKRTTKPVVWMRPEEFEGIARSCGFRSVERRQHLRLDPLGNVVPTQPNRVDYLLTR